MLDPEPARVVRVPVSKTGRFAVCFGALALLVTLAVGTAPISVGAAHARPTPTPTPNPPVVITFQIISASRGADILRSVYPSAHITVDAHANAAIIVAPGYEEQGMRTIASSIDTKNPTATAVDTYQLKVLKPQTVAERLSGVFPQARVLVAPNKTIIIMASPACLRAASGTEILPLRTSRIIAALGCAVHRSNFSGSGAGGGAGCGRFLIEHQHFAYQVSSSRGGHINSAFRNTAAIDSRE